jgi:hypothetical protein
MAEATAVSSIDLEEEVWTWVERAANVPMQDFAERIVNSGKHDDAIEMLLEAQCDDNNPLDERELRAARDLTGAIQDTAHAQALAKALKVAEEAKVSLADVLVTRQRYLRPGRQGNKARKQQIEDAWAQFAGSQSIFDWMPTLENFQELVSAGRRVRDLRKEIRG